MSSAGIQGDDVWRYIMNQITRSIDNRDFWISLRLGLLMVVDAIEQEQGVDPRTSEMRKEWKEWKRGGLA